jgi:NACalpha-BTF3-like transcription factor
MAPVLVLQNVITLVSLAADLTGALVELNSKLKGVQAIIQSAQDEKRDLTEEEWSWIQAQTNVAREKAAQAVGL